MSNIIRMVFHRPETTSFKSKTDWNFKPVKRWSWLHKMSWWFLRKTGALQNADIECTEYREIIIDRKEVSETIFSAMNEMNIGHIRPKAIYMGPESFRQALHERDSYGFTLSMGHNYEMFDLPVTVIPWMRGVVVVP